MGPVKKKQPLSDAQTANRDNYLIPLPIIGRRQCVA